MIRIFDTEGGELKVNENCFLIPELNAIMHGYEEYMPPLKYVYLMTAPDSPYNNLPMEEKLQVVSDDTGGDFSLDDELISKAITKLNTLYETPAMRFLKALQLNLDRLSKHVGTSSISDGKDGNMTEFYRMQQTAGKMLESFKASEKIVEDEMKVNLRGKAKIGRY